MTSPSLSYGEIFIHILLHAKLINVLGSVQSESFAHALYVRQVPLHTASTRLTAVCLCHISIEHWHIRRNVVSTM